MILLANASCRFADVAWVAVVCYPDHDKKQQYDEERRCHQAGGYSCRVPTQSRFEELRSLDSC